MTYHRYLNEDQKQVGLKGGGSSVLDKFVLFVFEDEMVQSLKNTINLHATSPVKQAIFYVYFHNTGGPAALT